MATVFCRGCAGGDGGDLEVESLTGIKGVDGSVGDIVRVVVGMFNGGWSEMSGHEWAMSPTE